MLLVRTILLALRDHFTTDDKAAIGYLDYSPESRKELAAKSKLWKCKLCPYDASKRFKAKDDEINGQNEKIDGIRSSCTPNTAYLFWIGMVLLLFSVSFSYLYLKLT